MTDKEYQEAVDKAISANESAQKDYLAKQSLTGLGNLGTKISAENAYRETQRALEAAQTAQKQFQDLTGQFKESLGRDPKPEELDYFLKFVKEGQLQPYEVSQILKSTPEYQTNLQKTQTEELQGQLTKYDEQLLGQAQSQLTGQYRQMGRPFTSAYDNAFAQAAQQLAMNRQPFMTQYLAGQQGNLQSQYMGAGQAAIGRGYGLRDETRQRGYALEDYYRQADYYNNLMNQQNKWNKNQALFGAGGAFLGAGIGGMGGGMAGAELGAGLGGLFGRGAGSLY